MGTTEFSGNPYIIIIIIIITIIIIIIQVFQ